MRFEDFAIEFTKRVRARGLAVDALGIVDALGLMVAFYRDEPVTGIAPPPDDELKFSWGVRDRGQGEHFEVNLARVVSTRRDGAPPLVRELELTYRFMVTPELRSIPRNALWCYTRPELPIFEKLVGESEALAAAQRDTVLSVSLLLTGGTG